MSKHIIYRIENVSKEYKMGEVPVLALKSVSFSLPESEFIVVLGASGSGKSTLLNVMGGMDTPSSGKIYFKEDDITSYNPRKLTFFRRNNVGFVFQFYNLMPNLTTRENVELATEICSDPLNADKVLAQVGLADRASHFPSQLSGGEQQRVAIARAIAKNPDVLMCDEPTGALDYSTGIKVLRLLKDINMQTKKTVLVITHNQDIARMADRVIQMRSGEIFEITENTNPVEPEMVEW